MNYPTLEPPFAIQPPPVVVVPPVSVVLKIEAESHDALRNYCIEYLTSIGFNVAPPGEWETMSEFMARIKFKKWESVHDSIRLWQDRGGAVLVVRSETGRIREICSNPEFDAFVLRNKKPEEEGCARA